MKCFIYIYFFLGIQQNIFSKKGTIKRQASFCTLNHLKSFGFNTKGGIFAEAECSTCGKSCPHDLWFFWTRRCEISLLSRSSVRAILINNGSPLPFILFFKIKQTQYCAKNFPDSYPCHHCFTDKIQKVNSCSFISCFSSHLLHGCFQQLAGIAL